MKKLRGGGSLPPKHDLPQLLRGLIGGFLGILTLSVMGSYTQVPWLMAPFGASCVLLFAVPTSPLAQPRNVIGGHFVTASVGLITLYIFGDSVVALSASVGVAIMLMQFLRVVHPPAGANPIVIILAGQNAVGFDFLLTPVLLGSVALVGIAALVNNIGRDGYWPVYWHGLTKPKRK